MVTLLGRGHQSFKIVVVSKLRLLATEREGRVTTIVWQRREGRKEARKEFNQLCDVKAL